MKTALLATALASISLFAQQPGAETSMKWGGSTRDREFVVWMKATGAASGALHKMESKVGKDAVEKAETIGTVYESMIGFWRQRGATDAVKLSMQGKTAAIELAEAAHAGKAGEASEALSKIEATCKPCHDAHRSRLADGTFLIRTAVPRLN